MKQIEKPPMATKEFRRIVTKLLDEHLPKGDDLLWVKVYRSCQALASAEWLRQIMVKHCNDGNELVNRILSDMEVLSKRYPENQPLNKLHDDAKKVLLELNEYASLYINSDLVKGKGNKKKLIQGIMIATLVKVLLPVIGNNDATCHLVATIVSKITQKTAPKTIKNIYSEYHKSAVVF